MRSTSMRMKVFLISFGVVSFAMGIKFSAPLFNQLPVISSLILSFTKPPYLYLIVNGIIITIAATSRFHKATSSPSISSERLDSVKTPPPSYFPFFPVQPEISATHVPSILEHESRDSIMEVKAVLVNAAKIDIDPTGEEIDADDGEDKFVISSSTDIPPHATNSKGAKIPRVTRPKRHETLESTWNMITEGRQMSPTKHLKKSDTWKHHEYYETTSPQDHVPKSKTFKNRKNYESPLNSPLRLSSSTENSREPSPSQDELNRRDEAFIKKFNEEMRLLRQESLDQYMEMINRGA